MTRVVLSVAVLVAVVYLAVTVFVFWMAVKNPPKQRVYDCTWVEISPDVSPAMREACRRARRNQT